MSRFNAVLLPAALALAGCGDFGRVDQGRAVAYDAAGGVVTVVKDSNYRQPGKPRFDVLPAEAVKVPASPAEMGPAPQAGRLLGIDLGNRQLVVYEAAGLRRIEYTPVEEQAHARVAGGSFPIVDPVKKTITVHDPASGALVTFAASPDQLQSPPETWKAGDEVRYYYKQPGQALRMMNVTRTDTRSH